MRTSKTKFSILPRALQLGLLSLLLLSLNNCISQSSRQLAPNVSEPRVAKMRSFYVRKHAADDYQLAEDLVSQLLKMGYRVTSGFEASSPSKVDAVITYTDDWHWDITPYLFSLDAQLREPGSDFILATSKITRSSLVRNSQEEMVRQTLTKLLKPGSEE